MRWWWHSLNLQVLNSLWTLPTQSAGDQLMVNHRRSNQTHSQRYTNTNKKIMVNGKRDYVSAAIQDVNVVGVVSRAAFGQ